MSYIESAVTVADIAKAVRKTAAAVESELVELGVFVGEAWDGRPAVAEMDAQGYVTGRARRERDHAEAWRVHQDEAEAWVAARGATMAAAHQEAYDEALRARGAPAAAAAARQAQVAAVRAFERDNPRPKLNGNPTTALLLPPPESLPKRVGRRLKGAGS